MFTALGPWASGIVNLLPALPANLSTSTAPVLLSMHVTSSQDRPNLQSPGPLSLRYLHSNRSAVWVLHTKHFPCTNIYHYPYCTYIIFGQDSSVDDCVDKGKLLDMTGEIYEKRKLWMEVEMEIKKGDGNN